MPRILIDTDQLRELARLLGTTAGGLGDLDVQLGRDVGALTPPPIELIRLRLRTEYVRYRVRNLGSQMQDDGRRLARDAWSLDLIEGRLWQRAFDRGGLVAFPGIRWPSWLPWAAPLGPLLPPLLPWIRRFLEPHGPTPGIDTSRQPGPNPPPANQGGSVVLTPSSARPNQPGTYTTDPAFKPGGAFKYYGPQGPSAYQCTAWANFRWRELGYTGPAIGGDGGEMAVRAGNTSSVPSPRAMASYPGHVMVVEEVDPGPPMRFMVSEGNQLGLSGLDGTPAEWGTRRWWVKDGAGWKPERIDRTGNGAWAPTGGNSRSITFAAFRET